MSWPYPLLAYAGHVALCVTLCLFAHPDGYAQTAAPLLTPPSHDTIISSVQNLLRAERAKAKKSLLLSGKDTSRTTKRGPTPFLRFNGGYISYNLNYRSDLDTPYTEKDITQHQVVSTLRFTVAKWIPLRVNSFIRRSNSAIFHDITDIQVAFDAAAYRAGLTSMLRDRYRQQGGGPDSIAGKLSALRSMQAKQLAGWLRDPITGQRLIEANEILKVPRLTYDMRQPDSTNQHRENSMRKLARTFLELYAKTKGEYTRLSGQADSLQSIYHRSLESDRRFNDLLKNPPGGGSSSDSLDIPQPWRWLLGVRNFGLGKNNVSYSELTAKNISQKGLNFEYNSWYYLALSAGLVDYRFQDFIVHPLHQPLQYMYLVRAGLGRLNKNYFILSTFGGQKQQITTTTTRSTFTSVRLTGFSAETKWQVQQNTFLVAEAAESFSPDLQSNPPGQKPGWDLSDKNNKALSLKLYSWFPSTSSRLEAQYKFTGANFQSFNSFQTNSEQKSWYIRGEQSFFNRRLKLVASIRTNDFSNPYIVQDYKANTLFKSLSLTFHKKGLPTISVGYMPISQLTMVGTQLEESRFQTFNASLSHFYRIGQRQAATNIVFTRFFNNSTDTGFIYYNSVNLYAGQTIFFRDFTATVSLSHSQNTGYQYNVLEGDVNLPVTKIASVGLGAKLNDLDQTQAGLGGFINASFLIRHTDRLYFRVEKGYLPGSGTTSKLVPNTVGNISFMKTLK